MIQYLILATSVFQAYQALIQSPGNKAKYTHTHVVGCSGARTDVDSHG